MLDERSPVLMWALSCRYRKTPFARCGRITRSLVTPILWSAPRGRVDGGWLRADQPDRHAWFGSRFSGRWPWGWVLGPPRGKERVFPTGAVKRRGAREVVAEGRGGACGWGRFPAVLLGGEDQGSSG